MKTLRWVAAVLAALAYAHFIYVLFANCEANGGVIRHGCIAKEAAR